MGEGWHPGREGDVPKKSGSVERAGALGVCRKEMASGKVRKARKQGCQPSTGHASGEEGVGAANAALPGPCHP